jgi:hypothetical protein
MRASIFLKTTPQANAGRKMFVAGVLIGVAVGIQIGMFIQRFFLA